jgi:hypothetical protein
MKFKVLIVFIFFATGTLSAQINTEIDGNTVLLKKATDGKLDLYYCFFQRQYYFFIVKEDGSLMALKEDPQEPEYYKTRLSELTGGFETKRPLSYDLSSLQNYINDYHRSLNPDYQPYKIPAKIGWYATLFAGITNSPFVSNPDNISNPLAQMEIEFSENVPAPRHTGIFQLRHTFKTKDFDYRSTELSLGYRYRFLRKEGFSVFAQVKAVTFSFSEVNFMEEDEELTIERTAFDAPFVFGIGADLKIGRNSYLTFIYSELFALFTENQGNFPLDFAIGYKLKL